MIATLITLAQFLVSLFVGSVLLMGIQTHSPLPVYGGLGILLLAAALAVLRWGVGVHVPREAPAFPGKVSGRDRSPQGDGRPGGAREPRSSSGASRPL